MKKKNFIQEKDQNPFEVKDAWKELEGNVKPISKEEVFNLAKKLKNKRK